jgi:hypothetical protein
MVGSPPVGSSLVALTAKVEGIPKILNATPAMALPIYNAKRPWIRQAVSRKYCATYSTLAYHMQVAAHPEAVV